MKSLVTIGRVCNKGDQLFICEDYCDGCFYGYVKLSARYCMLQCGFSLKDIIHVKEF
ncbi:hypothetical protein KEJ27_04060 [Candidatus Bathyarchaeota archaeon]|nr:hypothetical protein [Candidatus Bathyarchaeota archaeon]